MIYKMFFLSILITVYCSAAPFTGSPENSSIETFINFWGSKVQGVAVRETLRPVGGKITPRMVLQQRWVPKSSRKLETESTNMINTWGLGTLKIS